MACQLPDLVWPIFVLLGVEAVEIVPGITAVTPLDFVFYPYSHSLVAGLLWAAVFAAAHWLLRRPPIPVSLTLAAVVLSHWLLVAWGYWVDRSRSGRTAPAAMAELPEVATGEPPTPSAKDR